MVEEMIYPGSQGDSEELSREPSMDGMSMDDESRSDSEDEDSGVVESDLSDMTDSEDSDGSVPVMMEGGMPVIIDVETSDSDSLDESDLDGSDNSNENEDAIVLHGGDGDEFGLAGDSDGMDGEDDDDDDGLEGDSDEELAILERDLMFDEALGVAPPNPRYISWPLRGTNGFGDTEDDGGDALEEGEDDEEADIDMEEEVGRTSESSTRHSSLEIQLIICVS